MRFTSYLVTYFNFAFYLVHTPFRFSKIPPKKGENTSRGPYKIVTSRPRQILWVVLSLLGNGLVRWSKLWEAFEELREAPQNPKLYFNFVAVIFALLSELVAQVVFWRRQQDMLDFLNFLATSSKRFPYTPQGSLRATNAFAVGICVLTTALTVIDFLSQYLFHVAPSHGFPSHPRHWTWSDAFLQQYRYDFSLFLPKATNFSRNCVSSVTPFRPSNCFSANAFCTFFLILGKYNRVVTSFYGDLLVFLVVLTGWTVVNRFARLLKLDMVSFPSPPPPSQPPPDKGALAINFILVPLPLPPLCPHKLPWLQVQSMYTVTMEICEKINKLFSTLITLFLGGSILYHSVSLDQVLAAGDFKQFFFLVMAVTVFVLAAEMVQQMNTLYTWMEVVENRSKIPLQDYKLVKSQLKRGRVGIKASNIVTVTYAVLWNSLATVVTYFIICVQSRPDRTVYVTS